MNTIVRLRYQSLKTSGPNDQWWERIAALFEDCDKEAPRDCRSLVDYGCWAEHMYRFWATALSAREIIVTWAGAPPSKQTCEISPRNLLSTRDITLSDLPKGKDTDIERIGKDTLDALARRGIDVFCPWTPNNYRNYFLFNTHKHAKAIHHRDGPALICGFYGWEQRPLPAPCVNSPIQRQIGKEILRIRTLWPAEVVLDRVAFRPMTGRSPTVTEEESALRAALDLVQASIDLKLPLTLPKKKP